MEDGSARILQDLQIDRPGTGCQQSLRMSPGRRWPRGTYGGWPWRGCALLQTAGLAGCSTGAEAVNLDR